MIRFLLVAALAILSIPCEAQSNSYWRSRGYPRGRCNCSMCQALRAGLSWPPSYARMATPSESLGVARVQPAPPLQPRIVKREEDIPKAVLHGNYGTPHVAIDVMLDVIKIRPDQTFYDIGCGDAQVLIRAVKRFGCRAVGVEVNSDTARLARSNVDAAGLSHMITIVEDDAHTWDQLLEADVAYCFLFDKTLEKLMPRFRAMKADTLIVSYKHELPGAEGQQKNSCRIDGIDYEWWMWRVPGPPPDFSVYRGPVFE